MSFAKAYINRSRRRCRLRRYDAVAACHSPVSPTIGANSLRFRAQEPRRGSSTYSCFAPSNLRKACLDAEGFYPRGDFPRQGGGHAAVRTARAGDWRKPRSWFACCGAACARSPSVDNLLPPALRARPRSRNSSNAAGSAARSNVPLLDSWAARPRDAPSNARTHIVRDEASREGLLSIRAFAPSFEGHGRHREDALFLLFGDGAPESIVSADRSAPPSTVYTRCWMPGHARVDHLEYPRSPASIWCCREGSPRQIIDGLQNTGTKFLWCASRCDRYLARGSRRRTHARCGRAPLSTYRRQRGSARDILPPLWQHVVRARSL